MKYNIDNWKKCKLGDVVKFQRGHDLSKKNMVGSEFPVIGSNGIIGYHNEYTKKGPCITIGRSGNVGNPHYYSGNCWAHNTTLYIKEYFNVFPKFVYYKLKTLNLCHYAGGSAVPTLNRNHIHPIDIIIPSLEEQKAIAKILSDLDEKIEVNNKINKNLEEMAQAIFKQWFVDFEFPNEEGKPYKSSGGEMVESELGMIPKGWSINKISEISEIKNGVNYSRNQEGELVKVINVRDFNGSLIVNDNSLDNIYLQQKQIDDYKLKKFDTVIVRSAKPGETILVDNDEIKVYSGFTIRVRTKKQSNKLYIFYCLRNSMKKIENSSNGTIFKNLNQRILGALNFAMPSEKILLKYNNLSEIIIEQISMKTKENERLEKLRDTLLPKLMSGEIRVPLENSEN